MNNDQEIQRRESILKQGFIDVKVQVSGLRQSHRFTVYYDKTSRGIVPYLLSKLIVPLPELMKVAQDTSLPVRCGKNIVFPRGKSPSDFIIKDPNSVTIENPVVEAEVE